MNAPFQGKRALVTGGNKGIGFATCQGLLAARSRSVFEGDSLGKTKVAIERLQSSNVRPVELDFSDDDSIDLAAKNLSQEIDSLNVLINNADIYPDQGVDILTVSRQLLNQTMNINAFGAIRALKHFYHY